ncbi:homocysteine biosynthesis protein [Desulfovibrio sp. SGI.169]|uniref:homocysteine biosynthesis protein n=1 Tax=Desulfovibrio sp. SGI.169 TaxID=3420561 RepID=UPI003D02862C
MLAMTSDAHGAYEMLNEAARQNKLRVRCAHQLTAETVRDIDVLVAAQPGGMESSSVMLLVKVAERGLFTRAEHLSLNGIAGFVGPAPNERLGMVDVLVSGGMTSASDPAYNGATLFEDLLHDREIRLECLSQEHTRHNAVTRLSVMDYARSTIYDLPLNTELANLGKDSLFAGATIMLNGGRGVILGSGALGNKERPSLSCAADCFVMDKALLLPARDGSSPQHSLCMAFPLWTDVDASALCDAASRMARQRNETDRLVLEAAEDRMAQALATGELAFVDPGPKPYRTIMSVN